MGATKGKRGRPRKHAPKLPLPPLYVFIRNLLHSPAYNPSTVAWVDESAGCFKVNSTFNPFFGCVTKYYHDILVVDLSFALDNFLMNLSSQRLSDSTHLMGDH